jgi:hypothetical protein
VWEEVYELWGVTDVEVAVELAREAARLRWVPRGGYITVRDDLDGEGAGRRLEIHE